MPPLNPLQKKCLALAISQSLISTAQATTIEVNNAGDAGVGCTLRDAISSFNSQSLAAGCSYNSGTLAEPGTITFANSVANSTIMLDGSQLDINNNVNISIQGAGVTIDGNFQSRLLNISNATVSIDSMTLTRGGFEGGEYDSQNTVQVEDAALSLSNSTLSNNLIGTNYRGMFDAFRSEISINNSSIVNTPYTEDSGYVLNLNNCPSVTLDQVLVSNNQTSSSMIRMSNNNNVTISNSTISNNPTLGRDLLRFRDNGSTHFINNTISNNTSRSSIVRFISESGKLTNNTISGNSLAGTPSSAFFTAGGVQLTGSSVSLINTTITNNDSPQLQISTYSNTNSDNSSLALINTIIGNANNGADCIVQALGVGNTAEIISDSNSIIEDGSCNTQARDIDPLLAPLADNGGPTLTHRLLSGSPAINTGDNATCEATDQRGETRPLSVDNQCDVGALEVLDDGTTTFVIPLSDGKTVIFDL